MTQDQLTTQVEKEAQYIVPPVDVIEDAADITVVADLPGVKKEALDLKVEGTSLTLTGTITSDVPERLDPIYAEVRAAHYRRAFTLSRELDTARIDAHLKDGVLRLRIPKLEHAQPRRIEVKPG